jgi:hypothetical protein
LQASLLAIAPSSAYGSTQDAVRGTEDVTANPVLTMEQEWARNDEWKDWRGREYILELGLLCLLLHMRVDGIYEGLQRGAVMALVSSPDSLLLLLLVCADSVYHVFPLAPSAVPGTAAGAI